MSLTRLEIDHDFAAQEFKDIVDMTESRQGAIELSNFFQGLVGGMYAADVVSNIGAVKATGTITFSGDPTNDETLSIANVTFTAKTSGASGNEFNITSGENDTMAAALAAAINASSDMSKLVSASANGAVVTLTAHVAGKCGNGIELSENMTNVAVSAFSGGDEGTENTLSLS